MSRTLVAGFALISLLACGGSAKHRPAVARTASHSAAARSSKRTGKTKPAAQRRAARADTSTSRNPLTNH